MYPKTFNVFVRALPGLSTYRMTVHHESATDALAWVARTFEGVDINPTLRRWATPRGAIPRIGNDDPVVISDCDNYRKRKRVAGGWEAEPYVAGQFRAPADVVLEDFRRVFRAVNEDRLTLQKRFEQSKAAFPRHPTDWNRQQLARLKTSYDMARVWERNLWTQLQALEDTVSLELPEHSALGTQLAA